MELIFDHVETCICGTEPVIQMDSKHAWFHIYCPKCNRSVGDENIYKAFRIWESYVEFGKDK